MHSLRVRMGGQTSTCVVRRATSGLTMPPHVEHARNAAAQSLVHRTPALMRPPRPIRQLQLGFLTLDTHDPRIRQPAGVFACYHRVMHSSTLLLLSQARHT